MKKKILDIIYEKYQEVDDKREDMYEGEQLLTSHGLAECSAKLEVLDEITEQIHQLDED